MKPLILILLALALLAGYAYGKNGIVLMVIATVGLCIGLWLMGRRQR